MSGWRFLRLKNKWHEMLATKHNDSLSTLFSDLLTLGAMAPSVIDVAHPPKFREHVLEMFQRAEQEGQRSGIPKDTLRTARFAVAAFVDEMILNSAWPQKDEWAFRTLQYEFFNTQEGGVEFFQQLNAIRRSVPLNTDLLKLFYLCLTLGFEGQYTLGGREKRKALINEIAHDLQLKQNFQTFSPHAERPDNLAIIKKRDLTPWMVAVISVVLIGICYGVLSYWMTSIANDVRQELQAKTHAIKQAGL
jgi:type VI secretion system protein ImpK